MTPTIYKQLDVKGNIIAFKLLCRNDNLKTIEVVDALAFAEAGMTFDEIIEMLRKNRVHLITNRERAALSMINDNTEKVTLTRAEYEYAVKHNCSYDELLSFRKVVSLLKGFKVKVDV